MAYDRINITEVSNFKDLCNNNINKKWNGVIQNLHLIADEELMKKEFTWKINKDQNKNYIISVELDKIFGLYCIINLRFNQNILDYYNNKNFIKLSKNLKENFYDQLGKELSNDEKCIFYGFQSLSTEDVVLIILADEINIFDTILDIIKNSKYIDNNEDAKTLFDVTSVFTGLNINDFNKNPNMDLKIKLYLKHGITSQRAFEALKENYPNINFDKNIKILSGTEYLEFFIKSNDNILSLFHQNKILNGTSQFYKEFVDNSRTYWIKPINNSSCKRNIIIENIDWNSLNKKEITIQDSNNEINNLANAVSQFIIDEYTRLISSPRCKIWKNILLKQKNIVLKLIREYQNSDQKALCNLLNYMQTSLIFINQACSPVQEVPYHNYFYSGSFNDLLKMYYGAISQILTIGYSFGHDESVIQHDISFAVNFEATTKVHSIMYSLKDSKERLVIFHLPYEEFYHYSKMIKFLIHEVFHYIAPYNRKNRVNTFFKLFYKVMISILLHECYDKEVANKNLLKIIDEKLDEKFPDYIDFIIKNCNSINVYEATINEFCNIFLKDVDTFDLIFNVIKVDVVDLFKNLVNDKVLSNFEEDKIASIKASNNLWLMNYLTNILLGSKEAFCDSFIIDLLDIDFKDYLIFVKDVLYDSENKENINKIMNAQSLNYGVLSSLEDIINFQSLEIRLWLMAYYCYNKECDQANNKLQTLNEWINNKYSSLKTSKQFFKYIVKVFSNPNLSQHIDLIYNLAFENKSNKNFIMLNKEIVDNLKLANEENPNNSINLKIIQNFKHFDLPHSKQSECLAENSFNINTLKYPSQINDFNQYINVMTDILNRENSPRKFWYRGVCSHKYNLEPSLFRNSKKDLSLYANQANIIKKAYESTLEYANIWDSSIIKRTVLLQHYGMPTNLLDFSLDIFVALHFALNPDDPKDIEDLNNGKKIPVVYAFDPLEYNNAISFLKTELYGENIYQYSPIVCDIDNADLNKYFVNNMTYDYLENHTKKHTKKYVPSSRTNDFPIPIIVQHSNKRIQAQNGTFVAFSLDAQPDHNNESEPYRYLSLDNINQIYQDKLKEMNLPIKQFLYKVYINPHSVLQLRQTLKSLNISIGKMYPEYSKIFLEAKTEYRDEIKLDSP